ncbi:hypothetical protein [Micromonospora sp. NBC_00421]|uniref:hypothetical protein n=1 Tax=Micromonospora sp. NBC_00421 TaxID=2975976 RepID=UPI002E1D726F
MAASGIKPGWTRITFGYFVSDLVADYLIDAVDLVARQGHRLLPDYRLRCPQRSTPPAGLHGPPGCAVVTLTGDEWAEADVRGIRSWRIIAR